MASSSPTTDHAAADLPVPTTTSSLGWNGINGSQVFQPLHAGDSLMMWGTNVTVRNATVWLNYNGGVVNLGGGTNSAGDGCLIDGLYVVKTDWTKPTAPSFTKTNLDGQNNAVIDSLMVPGTRFGTEHASIPKHPG